MPTPVQPALLRQAVIGLPPAPARLSLRQACPCPAAIPLQGGGARLLDKLDRRAGGRKCLK